MPVAADVVRDEIELREERAVGELVAEGEGGRGEAVYKHECGFRGVAGREGVDARAVGGDDGFDL